MIAGLGEAKYININELSRAKEAKKKAKKQKEEMRRRRKQQEAYEKKNRKLEKYCPFPTFTREQLADYYNYVPPNQPPGIPVRFTNALAQGVWKEGDCLRKPERYACREAIWSNELQQWTCVQLSEIPCRIDGKGQPRCLGVPEYGLYTYVQDAMGVPQKVRATESGWPVLREPTKAEIEARKRDFDRRLNLVRNLKSPFKGGGGATSLLVIGGLALAWLTLKRRG